MAAVTSRAASAEATTDALRPWWMVGALAVVAGAAGLALRLLVLRTSLAAIDSDEAVVTLIGLHMTQGQFDALFWGQSYGGTIESLLVAPLYEVFGPSVLVGRLLLFGVSAIAAVLTWRIGRRLVSKPAALAAGALFWTSSAYFVWWSTKVNIYYAALSLALASWLLLQQLADEDERWWWPVAFGLCAGAAFWSNPQTLFCLVPVGFVHLRVILARLRLMVLSVPFAVLGALPWLIYSVRNDWSTLHLPGVDVYVPYPERVLGFFTRLPIVLGLRLPITAEWLVPRTVVLVAGAVVGVALTFAAVRGWLGTRTLVLLVIGYALLYGLTPQGGQPGADVQPRYLLFAFPAILLLVASLLGDHIRYLHLVAAVVVIVGACGLSAVGIQRLDEQGATLAGGVPADLTPLTGLLREHDVTHAYSSYWYSFRTTFETGERVIVTPAFPHVSRYGPYAVAVQRSPQASVIVRAGSTEQVAIERAFADHGIPSRTEVAGVFAVVIPTRSLPRAVLTAAFQTAGVYA